MLGLKKISKFVTDKHDNTFKLSNIIQTNIFF